MKRRCSGTGDKQSAQRQHLWAGQRGCVAAAGVVRSVNGIMYCRCDSMQMREGPRIGKEVQRAAREREGGGGGGVGGGGVQLMN